jgi:hypothetical protein
LTQILGVDDELTVSIANEAAVLHPADDLNMEPTIVGVFCLEQLSVLLSLV